MDHYVSDRTVSTSEMPEFSLPDCTGKTICSDILWGAPAAMVIFMTNNNSRVRHLREVLLKVIWEYQHKGVAVMAINPCAEAIEEESLRAMKISSMTYGFTFPYLCDSRHDAAKVFCIRSMPDFFIYDRARRLRYHGPMDTSSPKNGIAVTGRYLRLSLLKILSEQQDHVIL